MKKSRFFVILIAVLWLFIYSSTNIIVKNEIHIKADVTESYKIAFFTDTHYGKSYNEKNIKKIVALINESNVDIVIFGGDFFDNYNRDKSKIDVELLGNELSKIKAKYGKYAVYGNHDFGGKATRVYFDLMSNSGFTVLKNQNKYIKELDTRLIGFEDSIFGEVNLEYYNIKSTDFNILISHEPEIIDMINMKNYGIMLSGHTHGGQINNPYNVPTKYLKGIYNNSSINNNISLIVSKGIGVTKIPIRVFSQPEICIIYIN